MIPAARAVDIAGVAHIPEQVALLHGGPLRHGDAAHVGVQAVVPVAVVRGAVADLHAVSVAVHRPRGADDTVRNRIDGRAARRGKIGAAVGDAPGVRFGKLRRDAPVAVQRAAEVKARQVQVRRCVASALLPHIGVQCGGGVLIGLFRGVGHGGLCLGRGLLGGQCAARVEQCGLQRGLCVGQRRLLLLKCRLGIGGLPGSLVRCGAGLLQCGGLGVQLGQNRAVPRAHLLQNRVERQQLVQAFGLCQQPDGSAAVQPLHRAQLLTADGQPRVVLGLLGVQCGAGGVRRGLPLVQNGLCILHGVGHGGNLPGQLGGLPGQGGNLALGLRLFVLQFFQGRLCGLVLLPRLGLLLR